MTLTSQIIGILADTELTDRQAGSQIALVTGVPLYEADWVVKEQRSSFLNEQV